MELWPARLMIIAVFAMIVGCFWLMHFRKGFSRLGRVVMCIAGWVVVLPCLLVSLFLISLSGCTDNSPLIGSPDGKHVARIMVNRGDATNVNYARVIVRKSWSPIWTTAYSGEWHNVPEEYLKGKVQWLDDKRVLVFYPNHRYNDRYYRDDYEKQVGNVVVVCKPIPVIE